MPVGVCTSGHLQGGGGLGPGHLSPFPTRFFTSTPRTIAPLRFQVAMHVSRAKAHLRVARGKDRSIRESIPYQLRVVVLGGDVALAQQDCG